MNHPTAAYLERPDLSLILERWPLPSVLCGIGVAYLVAMKLSITMTFVDAIISTCANVAPLALLGLAARHIVRRHLMMWSTAWQLVFHVPLGAAFALIWYWALMVLLGLQVGHSWTSFAVRPIFSNPAIAWMLLQGLTFYALAVALTHLEERRSASVSGGTLPARADMSRYFIKDADAIRPIEAREIVSIRGAGDYVEVTTPTGRHLARRTLADFEAMLTAESFIRIHRTAIVNMARIVRAESTGDGRILIHLENGEAIQTSRAGAKALRAHVI
jgi:hypothetical protein